MNTVDLAFPLIGATPIPADHGYHLYAALSRLLPNVHQGNEIGIHPIRGTQVGNRQLSLNDRSRLVLRTDSQRIGELIGLAGKQLSIGGKVARIGVPKVWALTPATTVRSRLVVIKVKEAASASALNEDNFGLAARRQLTALELGNEHVLTVGKRRTLRIKDKEVVGYEVIVAALAAQASLVIQERGIGGRRHMGCGVFVPLSLE